MSIHTHTFDGSWLTEQGEAHIVLAQVAPATSDILRVDAGRPWVVETVRDLIGPKQRFAQIVTGDKPAILVLPELALGFDDWPKIDGLVRGWNRPLILIAGFGFTGGERLNVWLGQNGPTERRAAWPNGKGPGNERIYNGGWCWVHQPGATACVTFLKVTAEQHDEIHVDGLDEGTFNLSIRLDDLIIFPVLCSDLLSEVGGSASYSVRYRAISMIMPMTAPAFSSPGSCSRRRRTRSGERLSSILRAISTLSASMFA